jgi:hypothetical protein
MWRDNGSKEEERGRRTTRKSRSKKSATNQTRASTSWNPHCRTERIGWAESPEIQHQQQRKEKERKEILMRQSLLRWCFPFDCVWLLPFFSHFNTLANDQLNRKPKSTKLHSKRPLSRVSMILADGQGKRAVLYLGPPSCIDQCQDRWIDVYVDTIIRHWKSDFSSFHVGVNKYST